MLEQNLIGISFDIAPTPSDPLHDLGVLCGLENLRTDAEGLCCLAFGARIVHLQRWPCSNRIRLSSAVEALPAPVSPGAEPVRMQLRRMRRDGIALRVLHDDVWCVQAVFDGDDDGDGVDAGVETAAGTALLAAIERLIRHAQDWQQLAREPGASVFPVSRRGAPAFRRRG